jgi:TonB family protein
MKFLQENVKYPEEAMKNGIQGRVLIQFIVEKDGSISEAKVIKKVNELLDAEALRVIGEMPKWTPGKQKGQEVRVKFVLPVTFRLS